VLGWLKLLGQRQGLYDSELGAALVVVAMIVVLGSLVLWNASSLHAMDWRRRATEAQLQLTTRLLQAESEARRAEESLARHAAQLETANRELETFSYSVSHDLRAPLRGMDGFSQALLEDYGDKLDDQAKDYLTRIRAACQRMGVLIDDLLKLSHITQREFSRQPVDLSGLARAIATEIQRVYPSRQVEVMIEDGLAAEGDEHLLRVALHQLLENAWKFTGKQPRARIEFGRMTADQRPVFFVRDNGVGFDMAYADKLFGAFQRLHTIAEFPGSGIGLATAQRVIHRHGGEIWADAAPGQGATFYFTLLKEIVA
jgi:light-regulated signal transduction histidine kinase (bacteriophytochrome)